MSIVSSTKSRWDVTHGPVWFVSAWPGCVSLVPVKVLVSVLSVLHQNLLLVSTMWAPRENNEKTEIISKLKHGQIYQNERNAGRPGRDRDADLDPV